MGGRAVGCRCDGAVRARDGRWVLTAVVVAGWSTTEERMIPLGLLVVGSD